MREVRIELLSKREEERRRLKEAQNIKVSINFSKKSRKKIRLNKCKSIIKSIYQNTTTFRLKTHTHTHTHTHTFYKPAP